MGRGRRDPTPWGREVKGKPPEVVIEIGNGHLKRWLWPVWIGVWGWTLTSATSGRRTYSGGFSQQQPDFGHVDEMGEVGRVGGDINKLLFKLLIGGGVFVEVGWGWRWGTLTALLLTMANGWCVQTPQGKVITKQWNNLPSGEARGETELAADLGGYYKTSNNNKTKHVQLNKITKHQWYNHLLLVQPLVPFCVQRYTYVGFKHTQVKTIKQ